MIGDFAGTILLFLLSPSNSSNDNQSPNIYYIYKKPYFETHN